MSLEEELTIYQFGQGVHSAADLLAPFSRLDETEKRTQIIRLSFLVWRTEPVDSDIERAVLDSALGPAYTPCIIQTKIKFRLKLDPVLAAGEPENHYKFLLYLFKTAYQRRYVAEQNNSPNWHYWDLSNSDIAEGILTRHRELVDELYHAPGFHSEFVALAKLLHDDRTPKQANLQVPDPGSQTHFDFITYDEMVTAAINLYNTKNKRAIEALQQALQKAISLRYGLATDQASRLTFEVIDRHMKETYNTGLF